MMNILNLTTAEKMDLYKEETGNKEINVFDFEYWVFLKSLEN